MKWIRIRHAIEEWFYGAGLALAIIVGWLLWMWFVLACCNYQGVTYDFVF